VAASKVAIERVHCERLRISEIFYSLQGETRMVGLPTTFVRLTGCPLRCAYCDTEYAFHGGQWMTLGEIKNKVAAFGARYVTVTGGEPLAQRQCLLLLRRLCDAGYEVSLETSGALDVIEHLAPCDQVKFVVCDRDDYKWARQHLDDYKLSARCEVLFSPSHGRLSPGVLADWILADRLAVRFQIQLHKYLWGDVPGR
jgi:7-carboxy-7-deazaguanine synthase